MHINVARRRGSTTDSKSTLQLLAWTVTPHAHVHTKDYCITVYIDEEYCGWRKTPSLHTPIKVQNLDPPPLGYHTLKPSLDKMAILK